jgi:hypothetical protein
MTIMALCEFEEFALELPDLVPDHGGRLCDAE